ncbi:MAG TPA: hypothetical protein DCX07_02655 [Phycisphaerales bacterium]|nr:hypothetical protein [Phycisphaerales bacterium]
MSEEHTAASALTPLDFTPRQFRVALACVWLAVLATQATVFVRSKISVQDACGAYLPLADAAARGDWANAWSPKFPPAYPFLAGLAARLFDGAAYPAELGGALVSAAALHVVLLCVLAICLKLWSRRVALVAVALTGLNPRLAQLSTNVWLEPLFAADLALLALLLVLSRDRLRWWAVVLVAACAAAAPLIRAEGILAPPVAVACLAVCHLRRSFRSVAVWAGACVLGAAVTAAVWTPQLLRVHDVTGLWLLDVRAASLLGAEQRVPQEVWRSVPIQAEGLGSTIESIPRETWRRPDDTPVEWALNNAQSLLEAWNPLVVVLACVGLWRRRPLARRGRAETCLGLLIAMQLLATGLAHDWQARYLAVVAPLVTIEGAVGLVAVVEQLRAGAVLRGKSTWHDAWTCRLGWAQMLLLAGLLAVCAGFAVRRAQATRVDRRYAGEFILRTLGPDRRIVSKAPDTVYYARGKMIPIPEWRKTVLTAGQLRDLLGESRADLLVVDVRHQQENPDHRWCPALWQGLREGRFESARIAMKLPEGSGRMAVLDARRLAELLADESATHSAQ